jgi:hypothetical protein
MTDIPSAPVVLDAQRAEFDPVQILPIGGIRPAQEAS